MNQPHRPPLKLGDYVKARSDANAAHVFMQVEQSLDSSKSAYKLAEDAKLPVQTVLACVRANPQRFLERDGLIHRI